MLNVALTGNIASGKSTVARLFAEWGATVIDADVLVRELQRPGTAVFAAIVERFGPGVVAADGTLDRPALRARVMTDAAARAELEAIVHPAVEVERSARAAEAAARGATVVVSDIPLLFEAGDPAAFDAVVLVDAPAAVRRERIVATRALSAEEADRMIAAQMPAAAKRTRSTYVIDNAGDFAALERRAREVWAALRKGGPAGAAGRAPA